ncbi:MAG TPA: hypothetical protein VHQ22_22910 [Terriglobales bacterium]|nr:hypothetical protein [Terriglobales bacterium]
MRIAGVLFVRFVVPSALSETGPTIPVNCTKGQTFNGTLSET